MSVAEVVWVAAFGFYDAKNGCSKNFRAAIILYKISSFVIALPIVR